MKLNILYANNDIPNRETEILLEKKALSSLESIKAKDGKGNDFLGWVDLPARITDSEIEDIISTAEKIRKKCEVFVVAGIGGSYLGAKAVIECLKHNFDYIINDGKHPLILYAGNTLSEEYVKDLTDVLDKKDYCLCVISKSGTTTETAVAFRILREHLENKYGHNEAVSRIVAITDREKGVLKSIADKQGYKTFIIPDNVGGRFSVLTPVGLLPIAVAGFDIRQIILGANNMKESLLNDTDCETNIALKYAVARNHLYSSGKKLEVLVNYQPNMVYFGEWFKQLFGESEGKENKGLFPVTVCNTTDLHSLGQYIQQGERLMFETVIHINNSLKHTAINKRDDDDDFLNYLTEFSLTEINHKAEEGTALAHLEGQVSQIQLSVDKIDAETIGELIYFFELSCGISGYMLGVNPFDQPGVENYKKKMFSLLGKK